MSADAIEKRQMAQVIRSGLGPLCLMGLGALLARIAALLPLLFLNRGGGAAVKWGCAGLSALLWVALVIPLRCRNREKMRRMFYDPPVRRGGAPYISRLRTGLLRWGRGLLWGLPFLAGIGYFAVGCGTLPFTDMWRPIQNLPTLLGMEAALKPGLILSGVILALLGALFAYGWWRDMPVEYLPLPSLPADGAFRCAKRMRLEEKNPMIRTLLVNMLLALPGVAGLGAVLFFHVRGRLDTSEAFALTQSLNQLLSEGVTGETAGLLALLFLLVYLPLCLYRKMRNAALVARWMRRGGDESHAAG